MIKSIFNEAQINIHFYLYKNNIQTSRLTEQNIA